MTPVPRIVQVATGVVIVGAALVLARTDWSLRTEMVVFAAVGAVAVLLSLRFARPLPRHGPEPAGPDEAMPGAEGFISDFGTAGFRRVGGYRWALRGRLVISTVLAPAGMDRYAIVTDRVLEVASRFGDRMLITTNSGRAPTTVELLRQVVPAGPADLVLAHQDALDRLSDRGLRPDRFSGDEELLRYVRAVEERALRRGVNVSFLTLLLRGAKGDESDRELRDDVESHRRIDAWLAGSGG
jgi:hypothetical protein